MLYRADENRLLRRAIANRPVFGHGFGFPYKPAQGSSDSFAATVGRYYAHNFYLWALVKVGFVGLLMVLYGLVLPAFVQVRGQSPERIALASAAVGLVAISFVAPIPLAPISSILLGTLAGMLAGGYGLRSSDAEVPSIHDDGPGKEL